MTWLMAVANEGKPFVEEPPPVLDETEYGRGSVQGNEGCFHPIQSAVRDLWKRTSLGPVLGSCEDTVTGPKKEVV